MMATLARLARIRRVLAAVAALAALMLSAPAAVADCPPGTLKLADKCLPCPPDHILNASNECVCPPNVIKVLLGGVARCVHCGPNQIPDAHQHQCITCPAGTAAKYNQCAPVATTGHPGGWPGLLESTPGLGGQGPAGVGTPRGGGSRAR